MLTVGVNHTDDGHVVCAAVGELDASNAWQIRKVLAEMESKTRLLLDMSGLSFVDSAGLGALVGGVRRTREFGGDVAVVCSPTINRLFRTTGFDRIVTISDTMDGAAAALDDGAHTLLAQQKEA